MTVASRRVRAAPAPPLTDRRLPDAAAVGVLIAVALALRTGGLGTRLWMDEGIAVGIASHPLADIPGVLRLDGSPPLYPLLLHAWMALAGRSEAAVHWLSVIPALAAVPVARWAATPAFDRRTGWALAGLVACAPFITRFAEQARMYTLVPLVGFACLGCFLRAYVAGDSRFGAPFGALLAVALYLHNWALFATVALVLGFALVLVAAPPRRRPRLLRDGALGFGVAALLYAPWVPTLLFQAAHTGAPWATPPTLGDLLDAPAEVLGGTLAAVVAVVAAGAGLVRLVRGERARQRLAVAVLLVATVVPVLLGWGLSQRSPAWDSRYLAVVVAPALMLVAAGLAALRTPGFAALVVLLALWVPWDGPSSTSNAHALARDAEPRLQAGDLIVSTAVGQVPLLAYYLPEDVRFATPLGLQRDPRVVDWRDVVARLEAVSTRRRLAPLLASAPAGSRVVVITPAGWDARSARTALGRIQHRRSRRLLRALWRDPRFELRARLPFGRPGTRPGDFRALVFRRVRAQR